MSASDLAIEWGVKADYDSPSEPYGVDCGSTNEPLKPDSEEQMANWTDEQRHAFFSSIYTIDFDAAKLHYC